MREIQTGTQIVLDIDGTDPNGLKAALISSAPIVNCFALFTIPTLLLLSCCLHPVQMFHVNRRIAKRLDVPPINVRSVE